MLLTSSAVAEPRHTENEYELLYRRGLERFDAGAWTAAREAFEAAYALDRQPRLLVNIGSTYRRAGDVERAIAYYERFLTESDPGDPARAMASQAITKLREHPVARRTEVVEQRGTPGRRILGWVSLAVGAGAVTYGAYEGYVAYSAADELRQRAAAHEPWGPATQALVERGDSAERRSIVGLVTGGVATALGVGLILTSRDETRRVMLVHRHDGWAVTLLARF